MFDQPAIERPFRAGFAQTLGSARFKASLFGSTGIPTPLEPIARFTSRLAIQPEMR
jgi:hypothetical protein